MENFFTLSIFWIGVFVIGLVLLFIGVTWCVALKRTSMMFRLKVLGKYFIFFPEEIRENIRPGILRRYVSQYTKGLTRNLMNDTIATFEANTGLKSRLNRNVLNYTFYAKGLEYDFLLSLCLMQVKYLTNGVGVNEDTIDAWLRRLNTLISSRYITKAISQEARNMLLAELIKRFIDRAFPDFRFKNVFYTDFVRDVHIIEKIEPILELALEDIEVENLLFKMEIKSTALFNKSIARNRMWIYQNAVLCRCWIK